ncbi:DUF2806 domain-containing protein [Halodesulfovibrio aestuarii]|uniref:DUF2806 domain-containing protein n=1 Tax=Halodesulfovibrio aestuarii TaxID=126333 RepID=UPI000416426C
MGISIEAKVDATEALTDTSQNISKGSSRVWNLLFGKKEADIRRTQMLVAAQTQKDCELILSGKMEHEDGKLVARTDGESLAANILAVEQQQEMQNLAGNVAVALEELKNTPDEEISDEEIDPDFFARWRREAKVIGNPELQIIWGRILAEEVKKPDTISFRALDVIKSLTKEEAEAFCEAGRYAAMGGHLLKAYFEGEICSVSDGIDKLILLQECNLVSIATRGLHIWPTEKGGCIVVNNYVVKPKDKDKLILANVYALSSVGNTLLNIANIQPFPEEHLSILADSFFVKGSSNEKADVSVYKFLDGKLIGDPINI